MTITSDKKVYVTHEWYCSMKSTEVYRIARQIIAPWCKEHGFKRTKDGMLGWYKPVGDKFLVFWFQVGTRWDDLAGSSFIVEFQVSERPLIGDGLNLRWRLPRFLDEEELERVRRMQNAVIAKLEKPDLSYCISKCGPYQNVINWYLAEFDLVAKTYSQRDDIWLRYKEEKDVERWAEFVKGVLPRVSSLLMGRAI